MSVPAVQEKFVAALGQFLGKHLRIEMGVSDLPSRLGTVGVENERLFVREPLGLELAQYGSRILNSEILVYD